MVTVVTLGETSVPEQQEAERLLRYLEAGVVLAVAAGKAVDTRNPGKGPVVPIGLATDGELVWPLSATYDLLTYGEVNTALLAHARANNFTPRPLSPADVELVRDELVRLTRGAASPPAAPGEVNPFG